VRAGPTTNNGDRKRRRLWPAALLAVLGCALTIVAVAVAVWPSDDPQEPPPGRSLSDRALAAERQADPAPTATRRRLVNLVDRDAAPPQRISIPAIGVSARVVPLHREPDGTMETPRRWENTGWYEPGPEPGERGPAVIAGHVDSTAGPAVFYRLRELRRGNLISIRRADGSMLRFRVEGLERWPKSDFPTRRVFGRRTRISVLRLVTCAGNFDTSTGHYVDNTIVYAARVPGHRLMR
jgi:sortase (surface protein transpeptidase)